MDVLIKGRHLIPQVRLLEALTRAGLLTPDITWEESPDKVLLHVPNDPVVRAIFESKGFPVFQNGGD